MWSSGEDAKVVLGGECSVVKKVVGGVACGKLGASKEETEWKKMELTHRMVAKLVVDLMGRSHDEEVGET